MRLILCLAALLMLSGCGLVALPFRATGDVVQVVPVVGGLSASRSMRWATRSTEDTRRGMVVTARPYIRSSHSSTAALAAPGVGNRAPSCGWPAMRRKF